ncbi:MAG TPA: hypothetical protein VK858_06640 [Longimicrobiales bacterium]|nr:hypothetical protein [Longimicrobiales bacterium]
MLKKVLGVVAGYALWTLVFLGGSALLRAVLAGVHDDAGFTSDPMALLLYLLLSFVASFLAGWATARISGPGRPVLILALLLLATGIPVQLSAWDMLPVWYNLVFLIMLVPLTLAGGRRGAVTV